VDAHGKSSLRASKPLRTGTGEPVPDAAASQVAQGLSAKNVSADKLAHFPYLGRPFDGFDNP
jgi:hypothetical protein